MNLIEPCCTQRHWPRVRNQLGKDGTVFFHGYGDLSLTELLPVILVRYDEVEMTLVTPYLPDMTVETLIYWLRRRLPKMDGTGNINVLRHLTLISDFSKRRSPMAASWMEDNPFPERLALKNIQQNDTAILLPDIAVYGNVNLQYGGHFTAIATKNAGLIENLRSVYAGL